jgi:hypothetical protein
MVLTKQILAQRPVFLLDHLAHHFSQITITLPMLITSSAVVRIHTGSHITVSSFDKYFLSGF